MYAGITDAIDPDPNRPNNPDVVANSVIDADGADQAVYFHNSETSTSMLGAFTITAADHAIYCNGTSPVIENCVITENEHTREDGAGMYSYNASPTVNACVFYSNWADYGGGMAIHDCWTRVINCVFCQNELDCDGGGLYIENEDVLHEIINCTFFGNHTGIKGSDRILDGTVDISAYEYDDGC
ncbi:MAG TPA: right-handed parallel beta-helix repeat-containing protein [Sedimentisphaerales bacterium]|nr:right-handed parallel beta-helix repeat-containing protein [Sedimentisphaerales bacterium]